MTKNEKQVLKLKQFGKNKREFKKLVDDVSTNITLENGVNFKEIFKKLIGYDFVTKKLKDGKLEITDSIGEKFYITTDLEVEVI